MIQYESKTNNNMTKLKYKNIGHSTTNTIASFSGEAIAISKQNNNIDNTDICVIIVLRTFK